MQERVKVDILSNASDDGEKNSQCQKVALVLGVRKSRNTSVAGFALVLKKMLPSLSPNEKSWGPTCGQLGPNFEELGLDE